MSQTSDAVGSSVLKVLQAGVLDLEKEAGAVIPMPLDELYTLVMALPPIQDLISKGEAWVAEQVGQSVDKVGTDIKDVVSSFLKNHPALADLWAKIKPPPPVVLDFKTDEFQKLQEMMAAGTLRAALGLS